MANSESMERDPRNDVLRASESSRPGPLSKAVSLITRVASTVRSVLPGNERRSERPVVVPRPTELPEAPREEPSSSGVFRDGMFFQEGESIVLSWRVAQDAIERARLVAGENAAMQLQTVRISWPEGLSEPLIERLEHGAVDTTGTLTLPSRAPGMKLIAAIGLVPSNDRFVAIEQATLN